MANTDFVFIKVGGMYVLDSHLPNSGEVEVVSIMNDAFVMVKDRVDEYEYEWEVRKSRLSAPKIGNV